MRTEMVTGPTRSHRCNAIGCRLEVAAGEMWCPTHDRMVPQLTSQRIAEAMRRRDYMSVAQFRIQAVHYIAKLEGRL